MEKNQMTENLKELIEKLIDERGVNGAVELQLTLANGATMAGAVGRTEWGGVYRMVAQMRKDAESRGALVTVEMWVPVELVVLVTAPMRETDKPRIVVPTASVGGRILG